MTSSGIDASVDSNGNCSYSVLLVPLPLEGVKMVDPLWLLASPPPATRFLPRPVLVDPVSLLLVVSSLSHDPCHCCCCWLSLGWSMCRLILGHLSLTQVLASPQTLRSWFPRCAKSAAQGLEWYRLLRSVLILSLGTRLVFHYWSVFLVLDQVARGWFCAFTFASVLPFFLLLTCERAA